VNESPKSCHKNKPIVPSFFSPVCLPPRTASREKVKGNEKLYVFVDQTAHFISKKIDIKTSGCVVFEPQLGTSFCDGKSQAWLQRYLSFFHLLSDQVSVESYSS
jgi:hypothetical protein